MQINSIIIVGGGSSGWMTAALISKLLPEINLSLVESKHIPIIGVGESTLSSINSYLRRLEIHDDQWMSKCNATYKTSIRFTNFFEQGKSYHDVLKYLEVPFPIPGNFGITIFNLLCLRFPDEFRPEDLPKFADDTWQMIENNRYTDDPGPMSWDTKKEKAYHFDAYKFGLVLKDLLAIPNGTTHIQDDVLEVQTDKFGVSGLVTKEHGILTADLYIDCTGFKSLLLGETLDTPFNRFDDTLLNNKAVVTNIPYLDKVNELTSYTDCTTMPNGWLWTIPTWDKLGTGYVYSDKFVDNETAKKQFIDTLRSRYGDRVNECEFRYIEFTPGVRDIPWNKNVVGIGLSCGFIEPLRSTGLQVTHDMAITLTDILIKNSRKIGSINKEIYNFNVKVLLHNARDFVSLHYALSKRCDTDYWKHAVNDVSYFKDNDLFKQFAYSGTSNVLNKFNSNDQMFRTYASSGYNRMTEADFKILLDDNPDLDRDLQTVKKIWTRRHQEIGAYVKTLPTTAEFLKKNIYNTD